MTTIYSIIDPRVLEVQQHFEEGLSVLKAIRKSLGMTQRQFAERLQTDVTTLQRWESGKNEPSFNISQVKALCGVLSELGLTVNHLPDTLKPQGTVAN